MGNTVSGVGIPLRRENWPDFSANPEAYQAAEETRRCVAEGRDGKAAVNEQV